MISSPASLPQCAPYGIETSRLQFVMSRDGVDAALEFARATLRSYRSAVLCSVRRGAAKPHFASTPEYRRRFLQSCLGLRKFIREHNLGQCLLGRDMTHVAKASGLDPVHDRAQILRALQREFDRQGPYELAQRFDVLHQDSAEEFAVAFMSAINREIRPGAY